MSDTQGTSVPSVFSFESQSVRVLLDEKANPLFCGPDVCDVLGYSNSRDAITKHCRQAGVAKRDIRSGNQSRELTFLTEGNLYRLILKSHKPEAERFEGWVCDEVLPAIRKTGRYEAPQPVPTTNGLTNIRLSDPLARWMLSFDKQGQPSIEPVERYSIIVQPKYLLQFVDAAKAAQEAMRKIQDFDALFGLSEFYAPLRDSEHPANGTTPIQHS